MRQEGGYAPEDGGTNHGITQSDYDALRNQELLAPQSVEFISPAETDRFYASRWMTSFGEIEAQDVTIKLYDACFLYGVIEGVKSFQRAVEPLIAGPLIVDGVLGKNTLGALNAADPDRLRTHVRLELVLLNDPIATAQPSKQKFLRGWSFRAIEWPRSGIDY